MMREQCMLQAQQLWHMQQLIYQEPKTHLQTTLDVSILELSCGSYSQLPACLYGLCNATLCRQMHLTRMICLQHFSPFHFPYLR